MHHSQRVRRGAGAALWLALTLLMVVGASAQEHHKRVLLLFDEDRTLPGLAILEQSLRSRFRASLGSNIEFFAESMNLSQFSTPRDEELLLDHYAKKYRDKRPDLVMAVMGPSLRFLLRHGDTLFPAVPIVFCGADTADIQGMALPPNVTGVLVKRAFTPTIDAVLRLQPETRRIVVIGGTSPFDRHLLAQARHQFQPLEQRVTFEYLIDLPMSDLLTAVARLPADSVIVFVTLFSDGTGQTYVPHDVVSRLAGVASVPLYVFVDQYLGRGAVGGHLYSLEQHGTSAAEIGLRVLAGAVPASIPIRDLPSTANMFDARQLARWRLDERRLPAGSIVMFREPTFFDRYRSYIIGGVALVIGQSAMIAGLLFQRRRRRQAETELRSSYERISNLGGRLLNAQDEERAHLARELHDDVCQQMAVLQIDLHMLVERCHDGALQNAVAAISTKAGAQEALSNAIKHGRADAIAVSLSGAADGVRMTIVDNGVGFDTRTASSGLGLISMRERVEHAGGALQVRSQPGGGTHVEVRIPLAEDNTRLTSRPA